MLGLGVLVAVVMFLCSVDRDLIMAELVAAAGVGLVGGRFAVGV